MQRLYKSAWYWNTPKVLLFMTLIITFFLPHLPIFIFIFFCFILSSSSFPSPSPLHFLPPLLLSRYYLLVYFYTSHQTSNSVSLWWVWERSAQISWQKLIKHFWKSIRMADGVQNCLFSHNSPIFCTYPFVITRTPNLIFFLCRKPFAPPDFCSKISSRFCPKSQPCGLRTKFPGVEKGSLGCGESNVLSLKSLSEETIWKVWFLGRTWGTILGWFSTCLWRTW